jgi:hypothetical protein
MNKKPSCAECARKLNRGREQLTEQKQPRDAAADDAANAALDRAADVVAAYDKKATPKGIAAAIRAMKTDSPAAAGVGFRYTSLGEVEQLAEIVKTLENTGAAAASVAQTLPTGWQAVLQRHYQKLDVAHSAEMQWRTGWNAALEHIAVIFGALERTAAADAGGQGETVLAKVWFHPIPEENDYEIHDSSGMPSRPEGCSECIEAVIVARPWVDAAANAGGLLDPLLEVGKLIATQDNRCTDQPMFVVQQRRRIAGLDTDYCDNIIWLCSEDDYSEASAEEAAQLEAEYQETGRERSGWTRTGYMDQWEFVTACFTEQGCKDYLKRDGHNLKEPRIYAEGSYRNEEFRTIRNTLLKLAAQDRPTAVGAACQEGGAAWRP